jgi:predicted PurR-regulated permease PerM
MLVASSAGLDDHSTDVLDVLQSGQENREQPRTSAFLLLVLVLLAVVAAAGTNYVRAAQLVAEANTVIAQITDPDRHAVALIQLTETVAAVGDYERAETQRSGSR